MDQCYHFSIGATIEVGVITLTETLIILVITTTESNNCSIIHWTKKIIKVMFLLLQIVDF